MTGYLDDVIRSLVLILTKINGYIKTFKDNDIKLMHVLIDHDKLLQQYKTIWTKIKDLKNIELNALQVYDNRYIET